MISFAFITRERLLVLTLTLVALISNLVNGVFTCSTGTFCISPKSSGFLQVNVFKTTGCPRLNGWLQNNVYTLGLCVPNKFGNYTAMQAYVLNTDANVGTQIASWTLQQDIFTSSDCKSSPVVGASSLTKFPLFTGTLTTAPFIINEAANGCAAFRDRTNLPLGSLTGFFGVATYLSGIGIFQPTSPSVSDAYTFTGSDLSEYPVTPLYYR